MDQEKDNSLWAVLYVHNWDPDGKVYPAIHGVYNTFQEAEDYKKASGSPTKYFVRRVRNLSTK